MLGELTDCFRARNDFPFFCFFFGTVITHNLCNTDAVQNPARMVSPPNQAGVALMGQPNHHLQYGSAAEDYLRFSQTDPGKAIGCAKRMVAQASEQKAKSLIQLCPNIKP